MAKADLTAERLREILHYDPDTGVFTWRKTSNIRGHCVKAGSVAGTKFGHKYVRIGFSGVRYYAHRLAWLYVYGEHSSKNIDHINGDGHDNRIKNLREATHAENSQNIIAHKDSRTGIIGVAVNSRKKYFSARICVNGVCRHLGCFKTKEEAGAAYLEAKKTAHTFNPSPRPTS